MALIPTQATLTVGGRVFTDLKNLILIRAHTQIAGNYSTARQLNSSTGYTPSGANKFRILAVRITLHAASADTQIGYGDNDVTLSSVAAPTNIVWPTGDPAGAFLTTSFAVSAFPLDKYEIALDFLVPNGKYIFNFSGVEASYDIFGYEEA